MSRKVTTLGEGLILVAYIAAARFVADPDQAEELKARVLPALERYRRYEIGEPEILELVDQIMGPDWQPTGEWAEQLVALGFTRR